MVISESDSATDTTSMQTMNESGAFIWSLLEHDTTIEQMTEAMTNEYDVDRETAKKDIEAFVARLTENNLLEK